LSSQPCIQILCASNLMCQHTNPRLAATLQPQTQDLYREQSGSKASVSPREAMPEGTVDTGLQMTGLAAH
jgi:hypothetical protein